MLGLVQGPAELAPVSSSAHIAVVRALLDRRQRDDRGLDRRQRDDGGLDRGDRKRHELDGEAAAQRKALEVALHGGGALALALALYPRLRDDWRRLGGKRASRLALIGASLVPPSLLGGSLERRIERRLGGRRSVAAGLGLGGIALALADTREASRTVADARLRDGIALGFAQAAALAPGVSRYGATLTVARAGRFGRSDAAALSWLTGLPVILAAVTLKAVRLARSGRQRSRSGELLVGAGASFCSTLLAAWLAARERSRERSLLPYGVYRVALALLLLRNPRRRP